MTLSLPLPRKAILAALAVVYTTLSFGVVTATPAESRNNGNFYRVELAQPVEQTREVIGGVYWRCEGTSCVAQKGKSRPVVMCARLAREVGQVADFQSGERKLDAEKLARCNRD